jgi:hypothetical protein
MVMFNDSNITLMLLGLSCVWLDLSLSIGEHPAREDYIRIAHNPNFRHVSRQTTTRDLEALFYVKQSDVKE